MTELLDDDVQVEVRQKVRKSNVRIVVTYFVVFVYCATAVVLIFWLLSCDETELALGVFSGLSTLSAGIAGFWFGNRGTGYPELLPPSAPGATASEMVPNPVDGKPDLGVARRPIDGEPAPVVATFEGVEKEGDTS
ncbi:MAG: hypothetical protein HRU30_15600 [Rhodobacteraceae bacterium]|nr:hypothetical protein [Paracoccaceae bacterium]